MKSCFCSNCGTEQVAKLDLPSKITLTCPNCGKFVVAKRDKTGITVKTFTEYDPQGRNANAV